MNEIRSFDLSALELLPYRPFLIRMRNRLPSWTPQTHSNFMSEFNWLCSLCTFPWNTSAQDGRPNVNRVRLLYSAILRGERCCICLHRTISAVFRCNHLFCTRCINRWVAQDNIEAFEKPCPLCRTPIDLVDMTVASSKLSLIVTHIRDLLSHNDNMFKIVVISSFETYSLNFIHEALAGFSLESQLFDENNDTMDNFIQTAAARVLLLAESNLTGVYYLPPNSHVLIINANHLRVCSLRHHLRTTHGDTLVTSTFVASNSVERFLMEFEGVTLGHQQISEIIERASQLPDN